MMNKYVWIESDREFFGQTIGVFNFDSYNMQEMGQTITKLEEKKEKLSRTVNTKAMNLLGKEEEQVIIVFGFTNITQDFETYSFAISNKIAFYYKIYCVIVK